MGTIVRVSPSLFSNSLQIAVHDDDLVTFSRGISLFINRYAKLSRKRWGFVCKEWCWQAQGPVAFKSNPINLKTIDLMSREIRGTLKLNFLVKYMCSTFNVWHLSSFFGRSLYYCSWAYNYFTLRIEPHIVAACGVFSFFTHTHTHTAQNFLYEMASLLFERYSCIVGGSSTVSGKVFFLFQRNYTLGKWMVKIFEQLVVDFSSEAYFRLLKFARSPCNFVFLKCVEKTLQKSNFCYTLLIFDFAEARYASSSIRIHFNWSGLIDIRCGPKGLRLFECATYWCWSAKSVNISA